MNKISEIAKYLYNKLEKIPNIILYSDGSAPIISFNIKGHQCGEIGAKLAQKNIVCRTGLHCSAFSIEELSTEEFGGTVRFSVGYFTTKKDIDLVIDALQQIIREK